jgi:hypothetical protein
VAAALLVSACGAPDEATSEDDVESAADDLASNRARLLESYLAHMKSEPTRRQSNGLRGAELTSTCDLWKKADPSARSVFLTLTARLQGSTLGSDGHSMLSHVTRVYRFVGGERATATSSGSCGGAEANRMFFSVDRVLHAALVEAHDNGSPATLRDGDSFWRASHDLAGPHTPFDASNETDTSFAPRGQVQFFRSPTSALAKTALGRRDLESLVDPFVVEIDQDYNCFHDSNPLCTYVTTGPLCAPQFPALGIDFQERSRGGVARDWQPPSCTR